MARLCDDIERLILQAMQQRSWVELQRNILAAQFSCAPSQINYVLSTRFTPAQGYRVETRRGGGGFVRVFRIDRSRVDYVQGVCARLPDYLTVGQAESVVAALRKGGVLSPAQARLLRAAVSEPDAEENEGAQRMRAGILCRMLICAAKEEEQHDVR